MRSIYTALALVLALSACGIKRPLVAPRDIPAYEERQRKKREEHEQFKKEQQQEQPQQQNAQPQV